MVYLRAAGGGLVAGLIGAAIWAGIAYATDREVGFVAWAIGGLVGFGVRVGAQEKVGFGVGGLAVGVALLAIVVGKFAAVSLAVSDLKIDELDVRVTDEDMTADLADQVSREWRAKGKNVELPPNSNPKTVADTRGHPPAVWQEAKKRWNALPAAERQNRIAAEQQKMDRIKDELPAAIRQRGFEESFSAFDLLWAFLAAVTAFRIGSGAVTDS